MGRKSGQGIWLALGLAGAALAAAVAIDRSKVSEVESLIDNVVATLNRKLGKGWGKLAVDTIRAAVDPNLWTIAKVVLDIEQMVVRDALGGGPKISGAKKRELAIARLRSR